MIHQASSPRTSQNTKEVYKSINVHLYHTYIHVLHIPYTVNQSVGLQFTMKYCFWCYNEVLAWPDAKFWPDANFWHDVLPVLGYCLLLPVLLLAVLMDLRLTAVPGFDIPGSVDGGRVEGGRSKKSKAFAFFNTC